MTDRKPDTISFWRGVLPHWEVVDGRYFITIHLRGAIPLEGQNRIREMSAGLSNFAQATNPKVLALQRQIFQEMECWLDRTPYCSDLKIPAIADMCVEAIVNRGQRSWKPLEWVIMPSHIHLFLELTEPGLKKQIEQFKRWTGHQASQILQRKGIPFWQSEWFDHWSRSDAQDEQIINYIRQNPVKAGLVADYKLWPYRGSLCD
jgi:REP element-mobilizing transposase RayT